jgi:GTP-sensing pleiotropic transcriptional regulator CodY
MDMYETMENLRRAEQYEESITPIIPVFCNGDHLGTFVGYYSYEDFTSKLDEEIEKNC